MRRFLFWHQHSSSRSPSSAKTSVPGRHSRRLAFQTLERRDLKAADTTLIVPIAQPPSANLTGAEISPASMPAQAVVSADMTTPIPATPPPTDGSLSPEVSVGPAADATLAATPAGTSAPPIQPVGGLTTVADNADSLQIVTAPLPGGAQVTVQIESLSPTTQTSASGASQDTVGSQDVPHAPVHQHHVSPAPASASAADAQSAKSNLVSSNGSGWAASVQADTVMTANSTTSQDGYGGATSGYGGDAGYGGPTDGYGGPNGGSNGEQILQIDTFDLSDTSTNMTFSGYVSGEPSLAGATVTFGGQLAGNTTTVRSDGSFTLVMPISPAIVGTVTVQVTALDGATSNIATMYVS